MNFDFEHYKSLNQSENLPVFIMLIGLPGCGKSTIASQFTGDRVLYLSSDKIREELYGTENCQKDPAKVFDLMNTRAIQALKRDFPRLVIYDATNLNRKKRIALIKQLPAKTINICIICWAKLETCYERDASRVKHVGRAVIDKMIQNFQTPYYDEGWDEIYIENTDSSYYTLDSFNLNFPNDNPHHEGTVQDHVNKVLKEVKKDFLDGINNEYGLMSMLAAYHDIGKVNTKTFVNNKGEISDIAHYYNHQNTGAYFTLGCRQNSVSPILLSWLVNMHMEPFFGESKYFKNLDAYWKNFILKFNEYDQRGA